MNTNQNFGPSKQDFKKITSLDIEYLKGLTDEEVIELFDFLTQTSAGRKFAENASKKDKRLQQGNRRLGKEKADVVRYADRQITLVKNESDQKLIGISKSIQILLNKPITQIKLKDIQDILDLVKKSLWS